ncbi:LysR family transcriptional regulator [Psychromonas aquimarina]|uniref:LysR family transcriptional regulator n=1 Tax=Psychromonas aquimarina TaxID=444919 RepID=UPI000419A280|nr:LysR family transcriptional regulator [Psychromonas aquimarina]
MEHYSINKHVKVFATEMNRCKQSIMKTEDIKLFHQIVDCGSLNRTCEVYSLAKSNVSRRIKALEQELNFQLFDRHNRAMQVSHAGLLFYNSSKTILAELETGLQEICVPSSEVSGHLRIQLLPLPMILNISRIIFRFMDRYPKVSIEIFNSAEDTNLLENNIDVALRVGEKLQDSSLVARPFGSTSFGFYCTPQYIKEHGLAQTAEELHRHNIIRYRFPNGQIYSSLPFGKEQFVEVSGNLIMNSVPLILEACLQSRGIIFIPEKTAEKYVEQGKLVRLFSHIEPSLNYGWLVYPYRKHLSPAARTFVEYILSEVQSSTMGRCETDDCRSTII